MIYVIGGMKYSVSKVKASVNFSLFQSRVKNRKVLLVEADSSSFASNYLASIKLNEGLAGVDTLNFKGDFVSSRVLALYGRYDDIVIDSGLGENLKQAMSIADRLIVPFNAKDSALWIIWSMTNIESMLEQAQNSNADLKGYSFLINDSKAKFNDPGLIKTLRKSQFLTFLESPLVQEMFVGSGSKSPKGLQGFKKTRSTSLDKEASTE